MSNEKKKLGPFDYWKSIQTKQYKEDLSGFVRHVFEMMLSNHKVYCFLANNLNRRGSHGFSKRAIYDYYYHSIPKNNTYIPYPKVEKNMELKAIQHYFKVNGQIAEQYHEDLDREDLDKVCKVYELHTDPKRVLTR